jgi:heme-degrading monooxygenase HmoA
MVRLFVKHKVRDYTAWRKGYDAFESTRNKLGARGHTVYRNVDDGNDITAWHDFDSLDAAKAFANSNELKAAMTGAGVMGVPMIWVTHHT